MKLKKEKASASKQFFLRRKLPLKESRFKPKQKVIIIQLGHRKKNPNS